MNGSKLYKIYKFNAYFFFLKGIHSVRNYNLRSVIEWQPAQSAKIEGLCHLGELMVQFIANTGGPSLIVNNKTAMGRKQLQKLPVTGTKENSLLVSPPKTLYSLQSRKRLKNQNVIISNKIKFSALV